MNNTNRKFTHIKNDLFLIYMYMSLRVYVHMHVCADGGQKRAPDSLELELLTAVCHLVRGTELSTLNNTCSYMLSNLPSSLRYRLCVSVVLSLDHT